MPARMSDRWQTMLFEKRKLGGLVAGEETSHTTTMYRTLCSTVAVTIGREDVGASKRLATRRKGFGKGFLTASMLELPVQELWERGWSGLLQQ